MKKTSELRAGDIVRVQGCLDAQLLDDPKPIRTSEGGPVYGADSRVIAIHAPHACRGLARLGGDWWIQGNDLATWSIVTAVKS